MKTLFKKFSLWFWRKMKEENFCPIAPKINYLNQPEITYLNQNEHKQNIWFFLDEIK